MVVHAYYLKDARVRRYAEFLATSGHEIDVLCLNEGGEPRWDKYNGVSVYRVNLSRRRGGYIRYLSEYFSSFCKFALKLNTLLRAGRRYDIIHIHNFPNCLVFTCFTHKLSGSKIILDMHDPMPELFMSKFAVKRNHPFIRLLVAEERISLKYADFVIVVNEFVRDFIVERGCPRQKIAVIVNSPDERLFFKSGSVHNGRVDVDRFEVLYVGTIAERYGLEVLIDALAIIKNRAMIPDVRLTVVPKLRDEGSYTQEILRIIRERGLSGNFRIMAPIPHNMMPDVMRECDVLVYSPESDVHMDIALSLKIPEAIAIGRPVVASRLPVLLKYFGEESLFMFAPGDADDCAAKIVEVYERPDEAELRVKRAQTVLDRLSWEKQTEIYLGILSNVVAMQGSD